jgi:hypothetical protein
MPRCMENYILQLIARQTRMYQPGTYQEREWSMNESVQEAIEEQIAHWRDLLNQYLYDSVDNRLSKKLRSQARWLIEHYRRDLIDLYRELAHERFLEAAIRAGWDKEFHRDYHAVYEDELD